MVGWWEAQVSHTHSPPPTLARMGILGTGVWEEFTKRQRVDRGWGRGREGWAEGGGGPSEGVGSSESHGLWPAPWRGTPAPAPVLAVTGRGGI